MSIPPWHRFMRPVLEVLAASSSLLTRSQVRDLACVRLGITDEDAKLMLKSGVPVASNRAGWAISYLKQAQLVNNPEKGVWQITDEGRRLLSSTNDPITEDHLERYPSFIDFRTRSRKNSRAVEVSDMESSAEESLTAIERIERAFGELNASLSKDILETIKACPPHFFERLIVKLMLRLGYGFDEEAGETLGRSGDGGVDGVISEDKLGLGQIYLQAKRYSENSVGRPELQAFVGALAAKRATKGVFITTSSFSREAQTFAEGVAGYSISLVDGDLLTRLMIEHSLGVVSRAEYVLKELDQGFFENE